VRVSSRLGLFYAKRMRKSVHIETILNKTYRFNNVLWDGSRKPRSRTRRVPVDPHGFVDSFHTVRNDCYCMMRCRACASARNRLLL